jgi:hypothetical protein
VAISVLQEAHNENPSGGGTATTIAVTLTVTPGSALHVYVMENATGGGTISLADSNGQTYTLANNVNDSSRISSHFYLIGATGGSTTITATFSLGAFVAGIWVKEIGQCSAFQVSGGQLQLSPGAGTDAVTTLTVTPSSQPALVSGFSFGDNNADTTVVGTGFTLGLNTWPLFGATNVGVSESLRITSTAAIAATWTATAGGGANRWKSVVAVFTEAAASAAVSAPDNQSPARLTTRNREPPATASLPRLLQPSWQTDAPMRAPGRRRQVEGVVAFPAPPALAALTWAYPATDPRPPRPNRNQVPDPPSLPSLLTLPVFNWGPGDQLAARISRRTLPQSTDPLPAVVVVTGWEPDTAAPQHVARRSVTVSADVIAGIVQTWTPDQNADARRLIRKAIDQSTFPGSISIQVPSWVQGGEPQVIRRRVIPSTQQTPLPVLLILPPNAKVTPPLLAFVGIVELTLSEIGGPTAVVVATIDLTTAEVGGPSQFVIHDDTLTMKGDT